MALRACRRQVALVQFAPEGKFAALDAGVIVKSHDYFALARSLAFPSTSFFGPLAFGKMSKEKISDGT